MLDAPDEEARVERFADAVLHSVDDLAFAVARAGGCAQLDAQGLGSDRFLARLAETGKVTLCAPASSARWKPLRFGARATTFTLGNVLANRTTSPVSAIAGMSFGGTNEPTSISRRPAAASAAIQAFFASVGIR